MLDLSSERNDCQLMVAQSNPMVHGYFEQYAEIEIEAELDNGFLYGMANIIYINCQDCYDMYDGFMILCIKSSYGDCFMEGNHYHFKLNCHYTNGKKVKRDDLHKIIKVRIVVPYKNSKDNINRIVGPYIYVDEKGYLRGHCKGYEENGKFPRSIYILDHNNNKIKPKAIHVYKYNR